MKDNILKIAGIAAIICGSVALYFAGVGENEVVGLVAGAFVLVGLVMGLFKAS